MKKAERGFVMGLIIMIAALPLNMFGFLTDEMMAFQIFLGAFLSLYIGRKEIWPESFREKEKVK